MKKVLLFLMLSMVAFSETVSINMDYLVNNHPNFQSSKKEIEAEKVRLEEMINSKADELSTEYKALKDKGDKATDEEKSNFTKKDQALKALYNDSQKQLSTFEDKKINAIVSEIKNTVTVFFKEKKYDAIVEKTAIYVGGENLKDISEDILSRLKKTQKIELK